MKIALIMALLTLNAPDISNIDEGDWELHPSLGVVVKVDSRYVAYPIRMHTRVDRCTFFVDRDIIMLTYRICSGTLILTLAPPTMWHRGDYKWESMDTWRDTNE